MARRFESFVAGFELLSEFQLWWRNSSIQLDVPVSLWSTKGVLNYKWLSKPIRMIKKWHRKLRRMIIFYESWFLPVKCPRKYDENLTRSENTVSFSIGNASIFFILLNVSAYYNCALDGCTFFSLLWIGVTLSNFDIVHASVDIVLDWSILVFDF